MADSVRDYVSEHPNADYQTITARFGAPQQIAASYIAEMEPTELLCNMRSHKKVVRTVLATALVIVILWAGIVTVAWANHHNHDNGYMIEEVIVVERNATE